MNAISKPKCIVKGVTGRIKVKRIVRKGRKKLKFCVTNQTVIARQLRVGNVEGVAIVVLDDYAMCVL